MLMLLMLSSLFLSLSLAALCTMTSLPHASVWRQSCSAGSISPLPLYNSLLLFLFLL